MAGERCVTCMQHWDAEAQLTAANERADRNQDAAIEAQRRVQDAEDKARWAREEIQRMKQEIEDHLRVCPMLNKTTEADSDAAPM